MGLDMIRYPAQQPNWQLQPLQVPAIPSSGMQIQTPERFTFTFAFTFAFISFSLPGKERLACFEAVMDFDPGAVYEWTLRSGGVRQ